MSFARPHHSPPSTKTCTFPSCGRPPLRPREPGDGPRDWGFPTCELTVVAEIDWSRAAHAVPWKPQMASRRDVCACMRTHTLPAWARERETTVSFSRACPSGWRAIVHFPIVIWPVFHALLAKRTSQGAPVTACGSKGPDPRELPWRTPAEHQIQVSQPKWTGRHFPRRENGLPHSPSMRTDS